MIVAIRADASVDIGTGHVMRCMSLAAAMRQRGVDCVFVSRELPGDMRAATDEAGFRTLAIVLDDTSPGAARRASEPADARATSRTLQAAGVSPSVVVVDHYGLGHEWEAELRQSGRHVVAIDDLADRRHACDVLIDQNLHADPAGRYVDLVPSSCVMLLGPSYALLRDEFSLARKDVVPRDGQLRRLFVSFGGADAPGGTLKALEGVLRASLSGVSVDVVVGRSNPRREEVQAACGLLPRATCHFDPGSIASLMAAADLSLGAAGGMTWERCCLGLPSLVIAVAENQAGTCGELDSRGFVRCIGRLEDLGPEEIAGELIWATEHPESLAAFSQSGMTLVDGGGAQRCATAALARES